MSSITKAAILAALLAPALALADAAPPAAPATPPPPKWYDTFEVHGLVDTYYSANLSQGQAIPNAGRAFDTANGFQVAYAKLTAQVAPSDKVPAGFRLDLGFGPVADIVAYRNVQQAFVTLALPRSVTLDVGRFSTPIGAEVIEAKDNLLYSRSILFTIIPFTHTGARATVPFGPEGLTGSVALTNGWDVPNTSGTPGGTPDSHKTVIGSLLYAGPSSTTLGLNVSYGKEPADDKTKTLVDVVAGRTFGDLTVNLNVDYLKHDLLKLTGVAAIVRYSLAGDAFRLTGRGELLKIDPGAGGTKNTLTEFTLGGSIPVGTTAEVRLEYRYDKSDKTLLTSTDKTQSTVQAAALVWF